VTTTIEASAVEGLRSNLRGPVLTQSDAGYEEARKVWNGMIDRRPALIIQCQGVADVIAAVNFARDQGFGAAVRGGGHNAAGYAVCDDNVVIDLSAMKGIHVDPKTRTARVQPGVTLGELDRETQVFGLAVPAGAVSTTGVAGLTLGGGIGWLMGKYGLTVDNLLSAEVVTARGEVVTASESENRDLFWALRGGGGNFGVVTSFEFQAHPVGPLITGGLVAHPAARAREVMGFWSEFVKTAPDELTSYCGVTGAPDGSGLICAIIAAHSGSLEDGAKAVQPIKDFGPPAMDAMGPIPFVVHQSLLDEGNQPGRLIYWKSEFLRELTPELLDIVAGHAVKMPSVASTVLLEHMHGAYNRFEADRTAFGQRDAHFNLVVIASWTDPAESDANVAWARGLIAAVQPFTTGGVYFNYLGTDDGADRVRAAAGRNYERLVEVKRKYDPANMFRYNQNIKPS
jgi:FAD/FMN-containing dehydrogenase